MSIRAEISLRTSREPASGALYTTLDRLEQKGLSEIPHRSSQRASAAVAPNATTWSRRPEQPPSLVPSAHSATCSMVSSSPETRLRKSFAEDLLALFTARDRSESIVGDLIEQRDAHGRGWLACEVARLAFALCFKSLVAAPLRAFCLAALGWAVYAGALVLLSIASGLPSYPWHRVHEPGFWLRVGFIVFGANLITGGVLARWASRSGSAIAPLLTLWLVGWIVSPFWIALLDERAAWPWTRASGMAWSAVLVPLLYVVPLLLGAFLAQRREMTAATPAD